jgi:hypothetical protein
VRKKPRRAPPVAEAPEEKGGDESARRRMEELDECAESWRDAIALAAAGAISGLVDEEVTLALVRDLERVLKDHPSLHRLVGRIAARLPEADRATLVYADRTPAHGSIYELAMADCARGACRDYIAGLGRVEESAEAFTAAMFGVVAATFLGCFAVVPRLAGADSERANESLSDARVILDRFVATLGPDEREDVAICQRLHTRPRDASARLSAADSQRVRRTSIALGRVLSLRVGPLPGVHVLSRGDA